LLHHRRDARVVRRFGYAVAVRLRGGGGIDRFLDSRERHRAHASRWNAVFHARRGETHSRCGVPPCAFFFLILRRGAAGLASRRMAAARASGAASAALVLPPSPCGLRRTKSRRPPKPWRRRAPQDEGGSIDGSEATHFTSLVSVSVSRFL